MCHFRREVKAKKLMTDEELLHLVSERRPVIMYTLGPLVMILPGYDHITSGVLEQLI